MCIAAIRVSPTCGTHALILSGCDGFGFDSLRPEPSKDLRSDELACLSTFFVEETAEGISQSVRDGVTHLSL